MANPDYRENPVRPVGLFAKKTVFQRNAHKHTPYIMNRQAAKILRRNSAAAAGSQIEFSEIYSGRKTARRTFRSRAKVFFFYPFTSSAVRLPSAFSIRLYRFRSGLRRPTTRQRFFNRLFPPQTATVARGIRVSSRVRCFSFFRFQVRDITIVQWCRVEFVTDAISVITSALRRTCPPQACDGIHD